MGCGCNEQHNSNCFCQCEDLPVPQGPTGLQGIQGPTGAVGAAGASGADGADAFNAQLTSDAVAINLADTTGAFAGIPPTAYKYYNDTITTVFSLTEGGVPVAIDVANMSLSYGGEVNLATVANVAGGIELTLVRGLNTPTSNYGYVDMTYTHGALTFVKRFNVVYVQNGVDFQVGIDDTSHVNDPQEGMELLTKSGQLMLYQGGAWIQILDIHQTTTKAVVLTGALYTLNLTSSDERIISLTGSGTVNNNITVALPVAGCTAGTEFKVLYGANMTVGTGTITVFGAVIEHTFYGAAFTVTAIYNGSAWIVTFEYSTDALENYSNLYYVITPTVGTSVTRYYPPANFHGLVTYIVNYPETTDNDISIHLGVLTADPGRTTTRRVRVLLRNITDAAFLASCKVYVEWTKAMVTTTRALIQYWDNGAPRYFLDRLTGLAVPTSAVFQMSEHIDEEYIIDYEYNSVIFIRGNHYYCSYDGATVTQGQEYFYM